MPKSNQVPTRNKIDYCLEIIAKLNSDIEHRVSEYPKSKQAKIEYRNGMLRSGIKFYEAQIKELDPEYWEQVFGVG